MTWVHHAHIPVTGCQHKSAHVIIQQPIDTNLTAETGKSDWSWKCHLWNTDKVTLA